MSGRLASSLPRCSICGEERVCRPVGAMLPRLSAMVRDREGAPLSPTAAVCGPCLTEARIAHVREGLERERGELTEVEHEIARRAASHIAIADSIERGAPTTLGQRAADRVAAVGGSWRFVLGFSSFIAVWCVVNGILFATRAFDPYPFILLNLILSCLAALQAPIIMMSQSRMAEIDRARAAQDFRINLKAELEIAALHEKVDHLLHQQWERMLELQDVQLEILAQLRR